MTPEQAKHMAAFFFSVIDQEIPTTQKVIRAIPESGRDYRPDDKSRSAIELAGHLAAGDLFFLHAIADGKFGDYDASVEQSLATFAEAADFFDKAWPAALDKVRALDGEALAKPLDMMGAFEFPAVIY
ncbi:MAG: DinB family protein, partial [Acidobacteria bacterium]|nr:DinB family protein [Acidobacteriota bacterium]